MICSVGYSRLTVQDLVRLAIACNATVVDVRTKPVSRRPGFGRRQLEQALGDRYEWRGNELGGLPQGQRGPGFVLRPPEPPALERLAAEALTRNLILLCQEERPNECHRHLTIAVGLLPLVVDVWHLFRTQAVLASELEQWRRSLEGRCYPHESAEALIEWASQNIRAPTPAELRAIREPSDPDAA